MKILVTGAAGMLGSKLVARLARDGNLGGRAISGLVLHDMAAADAPPGLPAIILTGDFAAPGAAEAMVAHRPDVIFHLASIVSGEAESDFDLGYRVNLDGTRALFAAVRAAGLHPRIVFASSIAVFGAPFPDVIPDDFHPTPLTSYGTQKLICEALLSDFTRKGILDGVAVRLPTVSVRPGKPNKAASGFFSGIIREPLSGLRAALPVPRDTVHTMASPRSAVGFLIHAAELDGDRIGPRRAITMPGVAPTVGEMIEALRRAGGDSAVALIDEHPDAAIARIVEGWPTRFDARRAADLGFTAETSFDDIIAAHIADELGGRIPA